MKETYYQMKTRHQKEINNFPLGFAFSQKQFEEMMKDWELDAQKDLDKICSVGTGGYVQKKDKERMNEMFDKIEHEEKEAFKDDEFLIDAFESELGNHEYIITNDITDAVYALGFTPKEVIADERINKCLCKAIQNYQKEMEEGDY